MIENVTGDWGAAKAERVQQVRGPFGGPLGCTVGGVQGAIECFAFAGHRIDRVGFAGEAVERAVGRLPLGGEGVEGAVGLGGGGVDRGVLTAEEIDVEGPEDDEDPVDEREPQRGGVHHRRVGQEHAPQLGHPLVPARARA